MKGLVNEKLPGKEDDIFRDRINDFDPEDLDKEDDIFRDRINDFDPEDLDGEEVDEGFVDNAIVGAAKYAVPALARSATTIGKAGAKVGAKLGTRAGVGVASKLGTSAMGAGRLGKQLGSVVGQHAATAAAASLANRLASAAAKRNQDNSAQQDVEQVDEAIQWTKPKNDEHDEVYIQLDAVERGEEYPEHVHAMLKHLANKSNFQGAMKKAKPMTITHKDLQPGGKYAEMSNTEANESEPNISDLNQTKVRRVKKIFNNAMKHGTPMERPIVLYDTHTGHTHLLAGNTRLTYNTHYGSGSTVVHAIKYDSSKMNEEVEQTAPVAETSIDQNPRSFIIYDKSSKKILQIDVMPRDLPLAVQYAQNAGYDAGYIRQKPSHFKGEHLDEQSNDKNQRLRDALEKVKNDFTKSHADGKPTDKKPTPAPEPEPTSVGGGTDYYPKAPYGRRDMGDSVEYNGKKIDELDDRTYISYRAKAKNELNKSIKDLNARGSSQDVDTKTMKKRADGIKLAHKKLALAEGTMTHGIFDSNPRKATMALQGLKSVMSNALPASQASDILYRYVFDDELFDLIDNLALRKHDADIRTDRTIMSRINYLLKSAYSDLSKENVAENSKDLELYGLHVGDTVRANINGKRVQGSIIDIFPQSMEIELLLSGPNAGKTVTVDVRQTENLGEEKMKGTIHSRAGVVYSPKGEAIGEVYKNKDGWVSYHYGTDAGYDCQDSKEEAIDALRDLDQQTRSWSMNRGKKVNEDSGALDPETALRQARGITRAIKYVDDPLKIIGNIQLLAERVPGIDLKILKYHVDNVHEAQTALESAVYGLEEAFEDALWQAQNSEEDLDESKCWSGYKKEGTKMKGNVRVNNCVPAKESSILKGLKK